MLKPEREKEIKDIHGGFTVIKELLAEIDRLRGVNQVHMKMWNEAEDKLAVAVAALECPLSKSQEEALSKIRGEK